MLCYAGIGSRTITPEEEKFILEIAKELASKDAILYSGNAHGADIAFQTGSGGKCVLFLPWKGFNNDAYDVSKSLANFDVGETKEGTLSIREYHPAPHNLTKGGRRMMSRNYHQIHGTQDYHKVAFVVCCADENSKGDIKGGTAQACRIAKDCNIPVFNIRKNPEQALKDIRSQVGLWMFSNSAPRGKEIW